jgi:hypothetical protein
MAAFQQLDGSRRFAVICPCAGSREAESFASAKDPLNLIQVMLAKGSSLPRASLRPGFV